MFHIRSISSLRISHYIIRREWTNAMDVREEAMSLLIRARLSEDTRTFDQMIDVYVANGDIYLVGTCDNDMQRTVAAELVRGMPGVRQVIDNLRIRAPRVATL